MKSFKIFNKNIGIGFPVFFIAEAGVNHNGSLPLALKMVDAAKELGTAVSKNLNKNEVVVGNQQRTLKKY